jgi:CubicO group peptidase (beta-lactamase class C family)
MARLTVALCAALLATLGGPVAAGGLDKALLDRALARAEALPRLHALIVARDGRVAAARAFRGPGLDAPVNIKSISKSLIAALVGIAIDRGLLKDTGQSILPLLKRPAATNDARLGRITIDHLLSMRAGLERTSGRNYGRWVNSRDWVGHILARPFADVPGGRMLYSTGNSHLLSAILTKAAGRSTHAIARDWLAKPLGIKIPPWSRDPQGIYLGGNNMALAPNALLRFGELYRKGGVLEGRRILPESWVRASWTPRTRSPYSGDAYGYGWFLSQFCGENVAYARGFGGQFIYVAPELQMTIVITSDRSKRTRIGGYRAALTSLIEDDLIPAALRADGRRCGAQRAQD